jgi:transcriptional regulator with XRE-family HTH domain
VNAKLASKLRERARILGLAPAEAARRAGLDVAHYRRIASGACQPGYETLLSLCRALDTSPDDLLGFTAPAATRSRRESLEKQLADRGRSLSDAQLSLAVDLVELLAKRRSR